MKPSFLAAVLFLAARAALASQPFAVESRGGASVLSGPESLRVYHLGDNDSLPPMIAPTTGEPFDRWYTCSTKLALRMAIAPERLGLPPAARVLFTAGLGQNIYTPRTVKIATLDELAGDRPYSGWLEASAGLDVLLPGAPLALVRGNQAYSHLSLDLHGGTQGPWSFAGWTQFHAHHIPDLVSGKPLPEVVGWGTLETQPGLAGDVTAFAETSLISVDAAPPAWMQWSGGRPALHLLAGATGSAGSMLLAGGLHAALVAGWMGDPLGHGSASFPAAGYAFLRTEIRRVGFNATIDRPIIDGGSAVARHEPWVGEVAMGVVLRVWRLEASLGPVYRTNETASMEGAGMRAGQLVWQWSASYVQ
ncbi:MAG TPA: lipid A-modifier LpxR family protein [Myxococcales bacterium]|nr:lipid A-modifier LpxR family protein [Myxococcales bacterium]